MQRHAGLEARGDGEVMGHVLRGEIKLEGKPEITWRFSHEPFSDDSDNEVGHAIDLDRPANDVGLPSETRLPQAVAKHDDASAVRTVFGGGESAPSDYRRAEHGEEVASNVNGLHLKRMIAAGEVESRAAEVEGRHFVEDAGLLMPDIERGHVRAGLGIRGSRVSVHQLHQRLRDRGR